MIFYPFLYTPSERMHDAGFRIQDIGEKLKKWKVKGKK